MGPNDRVLDQIGCPEPNWLDKSLPPLIRIAISLPAIALTGFGLLSLSRIARADHLAGADTIPALERASILLPGNAEFHARLAELDPSRNNELDRALVLNPRNPSWWILRSVQQEQAGDPAGAEASLRSAVAVARYYIPLWSLTAFYYRQGDRARFIFTARIALDIGTGDSRSVFQMAAKLGLSPEQIQNQILPARPEVLTSYLTYSLDKEEWPSASRTALRLIAAGNKERDGPAALSACERLFLAGKLDESVAIWNAASGAHWILMARLNPSSGASLTDGLFSKPRIQLGFDWKIPAPNEVTVSFSPGAYVSFEFSGAEPENCDLFSQYLPLLPGRHYKFTTRFRTEDLPADSGLRWIVWSPPGGKSPLGTLANLYGDHDSEKSITFQTPATPSPFQILLAYSRQPGTTRLKGHLWLQSAKLELTN